MSGSKPGERRGGRQKGTRNRKTLEALEREQTRAQVIAELRAEDKAVERESLTRSKDSMEKLLPVVFGYTAYFQPTFPGMAAQNPTGNEGQFLLYFRLFLDLARTLAPYQSPTFRAIDMRATMPTTAQANPLDVMRAMLDEIDDESRAHRAELKQIEHVPDPTPIRKIG